MKEEPQKWNFDFLVYILGTETLLSWAEYASHACINHLPMVDISKEIVRQINCFPKKKNLTSKFVISCKVLP